MPFKPLFLTQKYTINKVSTNINIYDFQLRDHFLNTSNLYTLMCNCPTRHKHLKKDCAIVFDKECLKCKTPTELLITFKSLLYHTEEIEESLNIYKCCKHTHQPPCYKCINCKTGLDCIIMGPFECDISTNVVCPETKTFTKLISNGSMPYEHVYNTKMPIFYICKKHMHKHTHFNDSVKNDLMSTFKRNAECIIQTKQCCDEAILITDYKKSFVVTEILNNALPLSNTSKKNNTTAKANAMKKNIREYIIFDPSIWREQAFNHFMSFIRSIISIPHTVIERYKRFEKSNFTISNIKKHKSGKESVIRRNVTGFDTVGTYQTSAISCTIPYYKFMVPQKIYKILKDSDFDLTYVMIKRDPSLLSTCLTVCSVMINPDPTIDVFVISDQQSKGFNQDQDGDKNAMYCLQKVKNGYNATESYNFKLSKLELSYAFNNKRTLIAAPRYLLSENSKLLINRHAEYFKNDYFFNATHTFGPEFMNEAAAGYLHNEYEEFQQKLIEHALHTKPTFISTDDILLKTDRLFSIISSKAKGDKELLKLLLQNISIAGSSTGNCLNTKEMVNLFNKYITSSQELSRSGRKEFITLHAAQDLVSFNKKIYLNKICIADYSDFASCGLFLFNEASLELFTQDLINEN